MKWDEHLSVKKNQGVGSYGNGTKVWGWPQWIPTSRRGI